MRKQILSLALTILLVSGASFAKAENVSDKAGVMPPPPPGYHHFATPEEAQKHRQEMEKRRQEIDKRLKVTDEQKAQLKAIHENSRAKMEPKIKELRANKAKLNELIEKKTAQDKDVIALKEKIKKSQEEIKQLRRENFEQTQEVFTPKQRAELEKMMKEHREKMKKQQQNGNFCPQAGSHHEHVLPPKPPEEK